MMEERCQESQDGQEHKPSQDAMASGLPTLRARMKLEPYPKQQRKKT